VVVSLSLSVSLCLSHTTHTRTLIGVIFYRVKLPSLIVVTAHKTLNWQHEHGQSNTTTKNKGLTKGLTIEEMDVLRLATLQYMVPWIVRAGVSVPVKPTHTRVSVAGGSHGETNTHESRPTGRNQHSHTGDWVRRTQTHAHR
jgi:hypothetical protein